MSWVLLADIGSVICLLLGSALTLIAAIGLIRFPDLLTRMHSATKPQVLGLLLVLIGLGLRLRDPNSIGILLLVGLAQLGTSPVATHMVGRSAFRTGQVRTDLLVTDELTRAWADPSDPSIGPYQEVPDRADNEIVDPEDDVVT